MLEGQTMSDIETKIQGREIKTITIFYHSPPDSWDEMFEQAANRYGLTRLDPMVRLIAVPADCGLK